MKVKKIKVANYRFLKDFEIDLGDQLSLIIGKNNTGKTSLLSLLEKFLAGENPNFAFDDINLDLQRDIFSNAKDETATEISPMGIDMKIYIEYLEKDKLASVSKLMLNLDPSDKEIVINFSYKINFDKINSLRSDYAEYKEKNKNSKTIENYLKFYHKRYFEVKIYALESKNEDNCTPVDLDEVRRVIVFERMKANRDVDNYAGTQKKSNATLSKLSSRYYDKESKFVSEENQGISNLRELLRQADEQFTKAYVEVFKEIVKNIRNFGGLPEADSDIEIISALDENNVLKDNTLVTYVYKNGRLPEDHNGLGYMNLIYMIFEIVGAINNFKNKYSNKGFLADICLFFIEEPEVHTHPQMQYIFIKNIKKLLRESSRISENKYLNLQTIISTHSPHIASESNFEDIRYFYLDRSSSSVRSKNLTDLESICAEKGHYGFLKKYLTLSRAELLFADKAIFIEGDTERILIPAIMQKLDTETSDSSQLLLSQNISIVEVGAYSHIFEHLIKFLEIKCLIITDIDSVDGQGKACPVTEGKESSNNAITHFLGSDKNYKQICSLSKKDRILACNKGGELCVVYQQRDNNGYHARSFEDAFISINRKFILENLDQFKSLKRIKESDCKDGDPRSLADNIKKKTDFAVDIIYLSDDCYSNWKIPEYILEGLEWLKI